MRWPRAITGTTDRGYALVVRAALAIDLAVEAARAIPLRSHLGGPRVAEAIPESLLTAWGLCAVACAAMLASGFLTRVGAAVALAAAVAAGVSSYARVGGLSTPAGLDGVGHAVLTAGAAGFLLGAGGGRWSLDAFLPGRPSRRRTPR